MNMIQQHGDTSVNLPEQISDSNGEGRSTFMDVAKSRGAQEIQAAIIIAKRFPRNIVQAEKRILDACKRKGLAEVSQYAFSRGGAKVEGPSIRLAEVLAQNWTNLQYGVIELDRTDGESIMEAFCWDLETNVRKSQVFTVAHIRDTKQGGKRLREERDIYEMTANQGSRRVRGCILAIIPADVVDAAVAQCDATMKDAAGAKPLKERIAEFVTAFERFGVTADLIEKRLGHPLSVDRVTEIELVGLRKILVSLKDGFASPAQFFDIKADKPEERAVPATTVNVGAALKDAPAKPKEAIDPITAATIAASPAIGMGLFANEEPALKGSS